MSDAARERRLRRQLDRLGYRLHKTPARSWLRAYYGAGYMITRDNTIQLGCFRHEYDATIDEVAAFAADLSGRAAVA
jgi:hypothetical protein